MKTIIKFHLHDGNIKMSCEYRALTSDHIEVKDLTQNNRKVFFLEQKNLSLQTQYILTGADPYWILVFDRDHKFVTAKPYLAENRSSLSFFISEPFIVLLPIDQSFQFGNIQSIEIDQNHILFKKT
ncbi:MAG: hypothetical protein GQ552_04825 [Flavobacteriaceae bacterium]|nr:hypothetical protein [Flavobacteriaceae bacterium]